MSSKKKAVRKAFRDGVFKRDRHKCQVCGKQWSKEDSEPALRRLNAHHITDRSLMPNGGYTPANGITVCEDPCHLRVEQFHITGEAEEGLAPADLYVLVGSSHDRAVRASTRLSS